MHFYEILAIAEGPDLNRSLALPLARLGWLEAADPLTLNGAYGVLLALVPGLAKDPAAMQAEASDLALWVCKREGNANLAVWERSASDYLAAIQAQRSKFS
jgi:uncharacterized protein (DUF2342 family)